MAVHHLVFCEHTLCLKLKTVFYFRTRLLHRSYTRNLDSLVDYLFGEPRDMQTSIGKHETTVSGVCLCGRYVHQFMLHSIYAVLWYASQLKSPEVACLDSNCGNIKQTRNQNTILCEYVMFASKKRGHQNVGTPG